MNLEDVEKRVAVLEAGAYEVRIDRLEDDMKEIRGDLDEILGIARDMENKVLWFLLKAIAAGSTGVGAGGTALWALLGGSG